jgi:hypothetical protein
MFVNNTTLLGSPNLILSSLALSTSCLLMIFAVLVPSLTPIPPASGRLRRPRLLWVGLLYGLGSLNSERLHNP